MDFHGYPLTVIDSLGFHGLGFLSGILGNLGIPWIPRVPGIQRFSLGHHEESKTSSLNQCRHQSRVSEKEPTLGMGISFRLWIFGMAMFAGSPFSNMEAPSHNRRPRHCCAILNAEWRASEHSNTPNPRPKINTHTQHMRC